MCKEARYRNKAKLVFTGSYYYIKILNALTLYYYIHFVLLYTFCACDPSVNRGPVMGHKILKTALSLLRYVDSHLDGQEWVRKEKLASCKVLHPSGSAFRWVATESHCSLPLR